MQGGYNLLFGLWKYAWDADCELFLKILKGELKEGVYIQQAQLQVCSSSLTVQACCRLTQLLICKFCCIQGSTYSMVPSTAMQPQRSLSLRF